MLKNYVKIALRNLRKHKGYASINIIGLSLGIAAATLIFLFARNELTFDRFHEHADDIYLVYKTRHTATGAQDTYDTWVPLAERLKSEFPSVREAARVSTNGAWVQQGDERFREDVTYTDASLFEVFSFPLVQGDAANPLPHLNTAVISQEMAQKYFGEADPIGQVLTLDFEVDYTVTGVFAEIPPNSTLQFDILVPITSSPDYADFENNWGSSFLGTYIQLEEDAAAADLEAQFPTLITDIWDADVASRTDFKLLPLLDVNDTLTGNRQYAYILLAIALATILIACINFINLATARSVERAREIGVRKVLGAERKQLIRQLLSESVLMGLLALVAGVALAQVLLPVFNELYETTLRLHLLQEPAMLLGLLGVGLTVGLLAGSYPALFLSRFEPIKSLRGTSTLRPGGLRLRHGLVVVQFALSIFLIAGTAVMWNQVRYMKTQNLGLDKENVVVLTVDSNDFADPEEATVRLQTFKDELARLPDVQGVASSSRVPGNGFGSFVFARPEGGDDEQPLRLRWVAVDEYFFDTFGVTFAEGRNFIPGSEADRNEALIINEAALRDFGWTDTANKTVRVGRTDFQVIGVVKDYNYDSLQQAVEPVLHIYRPPDGGAHNFVSVRLRSGDYDASLAAIEAAWTRLDPTRTFDYAFLDQTFDQLYQAQDRLVTVASAFAILAILIACLGLFGLASLMVTQRTKEIGVRKVLGASVPGVAMLLSKDFITLVLVAFVVAAPVAYFAMTRWLEGFAYRIDVGLGTLVLAGVLALLIALVTVSIQAMRAAMADPVQSLRYE